MLIEFDGRQHFEAIEAWGGQKSLEKNKKNDKEKTKYAKELKLSMLRWSNFSNSMVVSRFFNAIST